MPFSGINTPLTISNVNERMIFDFHHRLTRPGCQTLSTTNFFFARKILASFLPLMTHIQTIAYHIASDEKQFLSMVPPVINAVSLSVIENLPQAHALIDFIWIEIDQKKKKTQKIDIDAIFQQFPSIPTMIVQSKRGD